MNRILMKNTHIQISEIGKDRKHVDKYPMDLSCLQLANVSVFDEKLLCFTRRGSCAYIAKTIHLYSKQMLRNKPPIFKKTGFFDQLEFLYRSTVLCIVF